MQWHAETCKSKFLVETKFLEPKEIFIDVFCKIAANELLTSVIEGLRAIHAAVVQSGTEQIREMSSHSFMNDTKFTTEAFNIFFDVCLQCIEISARGIQGVQDDLLFGEHSAPDNLRRHCCSGGLGDGDVERFLRGFQIRAQGPGNI